jgi:cation diffusion facilitator CzcD-associated flavoprotein CzcO
MAEHFDVMVVGAGISGIGAAYHLQARCPDRTYVVLEGRADLGGTWDLFRYPGIRSDSDMHTLGYRFKPWEARKAIADGDDILAYLRETATEYGIDRHIRFNHRVTKAAWSSEDARWEVEVSRTDTGETVALTCNFLFMCSGYYDYDKGYTPDFRGVDRFEGQVVHPQQWTDEVEVEGKRVVVIGSGATAVTLVPELAKKAAHVTMLQRSPTYIFSRPPEDRIGNAMRRVLPSKTAYFLTRWKNVLVSMAFFQLSRRAPNRVAKLFIDGARKQLGEDYDVATHFTPRYKPWDQRVCLVPDGDLFQAIKGGSASVVTGEIETFTETGLQLKSGETVPADLVVTATGLRLVVLGGVEITVDGEPVQASDTMSYKAMMFSDVPNLALSFGYTNASWTLKADLTSEYVCRLLNHMKEHGYRRCVARREGAEVSEAPFLDFSSGYVTRALKDLPKQGSRAPWKLYQNYLLDVLTIRYSRIDDDVMEFA